MYVRVYTMFYYLFQKEIASLTPFAQSQEKPSTLNNFCNQNFCRKRSSGFCGGYWRRVHGYLHGIWRSHAPRCQLSRVVKVTSNDGGITLGHFESPLEKLSGIVLLFSFRGFTYLKPTAKAPGRMLVKRDHPFLSGAMFLYGRVGSCFEVDFLQDRMWFFSEIFKPASMSHIVPVVASHAMLYLVEQWNTRSPRLFECMKGWIRMVWHVGLRGKLMIIGIC